LSVILKFAPKVGMTQPLSSLSFDFGDMSIEFVAKISKTQNWQITGFENLSLEVFLVD
jgi:hypothetical protein